MNKIFSIIVVTLLLCTSFVFSQEEFKPSGKVHGYTFGDFFYKIASDTITAKTSTTWGDGEFAKIQEHYYAFTFRRIYFGYDYNISPKFSTYFLLEGTDGVLTAGGDRTLFVKAMYLKWQEFLPKTDLMIGHFSTPAFGISEKVWSYRHIEKTVADFRKFTSSNDVGIGLSGTPLGFLGYNVMWGNNRGPKPEDNRLKKFYGDVYAKFLNEDLVIDLYADYHADGKIANDKPQSKTTLKGFIGYTSALVSGGFEVATQTQKNYKVRTQGTKKDTLNITPMCVSVFVRGTIIPRKLFAFARYDMYNPDSGYKNSATVSDNVKNPYNENFVTIGLDYAPHKNVRIIPNLWMNTYSDKREKKVERTADIVPRVTFRFDFK